MFGQNMKKITKRLPAYVLGAVLGPVIGAVWVRFDPGGIPNRMISLIEPAADFSGNLMLGNCMGGIAFVLPFYLLLWILIGATADLGMRKGIGFLKKRGDADEIFPVNQSARNIAQQDGRGHGDKPQN
jgi:hypothetical protein